MKLPGQFWSCAGDEALMGLETSGVKAAGICSSLIQVTAIPLKMVMRPRPTEGDA
jgi:hypothetical protein